MPAAALEAALALEARRMAGCDDLAAASFARERDVVQAERAQRATPMAAALADVRAALFGPAHAYARAIDSPAIADLSAAEVCGFMRAP